jgi:hypothetical protein
MCSDARMVMTKTNQTRTRFSALSKLDECQEASNGIGTHKRRELKWECLLKEVVVLTRLSKVETWTYSKVKCDNRGKVAYAELC